jgi:hypothetical protein
MNDKFSPAVYYMENNSDIIFTEFPDKLKVDLTKARELVAHRLDFTQNKKHFMIIDISNVSEVTTEAKEYLQRADSGLKNILGAAFIGTNPVSTMIANIFIKTPKDFQAKFFSNREDAFDWIHELKKKIVANIAD